jgi:hypothetical protein
VDAALLGWVPERQQRQGSRFIDAFPVAGSTGTETCSCAIATSSPRIDEKVANLVAERTLEHCKHFCPAFPLCLRSHVVQRQV